MLQGLLLLCACLRAFSHGALADKVEVITKTTKLPYEIVFKVDRTLSNGQIVKVQTGVPGRLTKTYRVSYRNGKKIAVQMLSSMKSSPRDEIYRVGDSNRLSTRGDFTRTRVLTMSASAYCAAEFARSSRNAYATATGAKAIRGIAAVDPNVIPLGTILYVEGYGLAVAADTGGGIKGHRIDLCMNSIAEMTQWGRRTVHVHILGR